MQVGFIGLTVPSIYNFDSGGGVHMWYIKLKDFYHLLYVESPPMLDWTLFADKLLVAECRGHYLRDSRLLHQAVHTSPVSEDIRPDTKAEHGIIHYHTLYHMD